MPQLQLSATEAAMLHDILRQYLTDLRMEIANTDAQAYRDQLKVEEQFLNQLLVQLSSEG